MTKRTQGKHSNTTIAQQGGVCSICTEPLIQIKEKVGTNKEKVTIQLDCHNSHIHAHSENGPRFDKNVNTHNVENLTAAHSSCNNLIDSQENLEDTTPSALKDAKQVIIDKTSNKALSSFVEDAPNFHLNKSNKNN